MEKGNLNHHHVAAPARGVLVILEFKGGRKAAQAPAAGSESVTAAKGDIVYINLDTLVNQYDMYNDLRSELQGKLSAIENDINKQGRALENDIKSFQEKMQKGLLTRSQSESMNNDLAQRDQDLRKLTKQKQMEMAEEESVMRNQGMDAIMPYVEAYNKEKQYSLILSTTTATTTVINGNPGLDITQEILNGLNAEYIKNRN